MTTFWVELDSHRLIEADDVEEGPNGELIFYVEGKRVEYLLDTEWLDFGVVKNEEEED